MSFVLDAVQLPLLCELCTETPCFSLLLLLCSFSHQSCDHVCLSHEIQSFPKPWRVLYQCETPRIGFPITCICVLLLFLRNEEMRGIVKSSGHTEQPSLGLPGNVFWMCLFFFLLLLTDRHKIIISCPRRCDPYAFPSATKSAHSSVFLYILLTREYAAAQ